MYRTITIKTKNRQVQLRRKKKRSILIRHTLQPNVTDQSWAGLDDSRKKRIFHTFLPTTIFSPNLLTSPPKGRCACTGVGEDFSPHWDALQRHRKRSSIFRVSEIVSRLNYSSMGSRGRRWFNRGIVWKFGILGGGGGLNTLRGIRSMREILRLILWLFVGRAF